MTVPAHRFTPAAACALVFLGMIACAPDVRAQQTDSSTAVLLQHLVPTPDAALAHRPGVFMYSFRAAGWPDGPAPYGVDPAAVRFKVDGHPFDDLVTGRPRYDLAPSVLIRGVRLAGPFDARAGTDPLSVDAPLTRIRYTSTEDGLQEARVLHVQDRTLPGWFASDSTSSARRLNVLFGYEGAGATNAYPGSRLRRARRVIGRAAVRSERWEFSVLNVANRRRVGAHGGVQPIPGRGYDSIFQRLGAVVTDENHARRTIRNDLILGAAGRDAHGGARAAAGHLFWTAETFSFDDGSSLDRWEVHRLGARLSTSTSVGAVTANGPRIGLEASAAHESPGSHTDSLVTTGIGRDGRVLAGAAATAAATLRTFELALRGGAGLDDDRMYPDLSASLTHTRFELAASFAGRQNSWMDHTGFFGYAAPFAEPPDPRNLTLTAAARASVGLLSFEPRAAFVRETDAAVRMLGSTATASTAGTLSGPAARATFTLHIGLNDRASGGLYATLSPSVHTSGLDARTEFDRAWADAVPDAWIDGRLGLRRLMFKGDLDLNLYVRGRAWTDMRGRRLHTPTGLLMLAPDGSVTVGSSGLTDIVAEAGIRGAVIFLAWENVISGTSVQAGNLLIPDYPLPAQRVRFAVYWPISN